MNIVGAPITKKFGHTFYKLENLTKPKLWKAIEGLSYKAQIAFGAHITEIISWRFKGLVDESFLQDCFNRIQAMWAAAIDEKYSQILDFSFSIDLPDDDIRDNHEVSMSLVDDMSRRYKRHQTWISEFIVKQCILGLWFLPDQKVFSDWVSEILRKLTAEFPWPYSPETYTIGADYQLDFSEEAPVCRAFFERDFENTPENTKKAVNDFLQSLDYKTNPYLKTPEEMITDGFQGEPYVY